jgi:hypothetical protein
VEKSQSLRKLGNSIDEDGHCNRNFPDREVLATFVADHIVYQQWLRTVAEENGMVLDVSAKVQWRQLATGGPKSNIKRFLLDFETQLPFLRDQTQDKDAKTGCTSRS